MTSFLGEALGWDTFADMTGEYRIRGNYADFALKDGADLLAIIEVKAAGTTLAAKHLYQAVSYAANEGVDWVLLTNGDDWHAYRVLFNKPVEHVLVFKASLTDSDMKPADRVELFYLLSKEARRCAELDAYYERRVALSGSNIAKTLLGEKMLTTLRAELRKATGQKVAPDELAAIMAADVLRPDVQSEDTARLIKKAAAAPRKPARRAASQAEPAATAPGAV
ncbi:MAG: hypothetical protein GX624_04940 [Actinobacteria bacterium]|nr:hypothetical protein [Actinomycetota bacterium]